MHRVLAAVNGLRLRLRDAQYLSAHPRLEKGLLRWYGAAHAGMYIIMYAPHSMYCNCVFHSSRIVH